MGKFVIVAKENAVKLANAIAGLDGLAFNKRLRVKVVYSIAPGVISQMVCRGVFASYYNVSVEGVHEILQVRDSVMKVFHGLSATALHEVRHRQQVEDKDIDLLRPDALSRRYPKIAKMVDTVQIVGKDDLEVRTEYDAVARQMMYTQGVITGRIHPSIDQALRFVRASSSEILSAGF